MLFDVSIVLLFATGFLFHLMGMVSMVCYPFRRRLPHPFTVVGWGSLFTGLSIVLIVVGSFFRSG